MRRSWVRRDQVDDRLDRFRGARHDAGIFVVGFRVLWRMTIDLAARQVVVIPCGEIIAVFRWREGAGQRQDLQSMLGQFQITDDLRAQQAHHVRKLGELVPGKISSVTAAPPTICLRSSTTTFLPARARYARSDQSVVPTADDDCVVLIGCHR